MRNKPMLKLLIIKENDIVIFIAVGKSWMFPIRLKRMGAAKPPLPTNVFNSKIWNHLRLTFITTRKKVIGVFF